jgi:putative multiple sugar transport system substrate-binding protein
MRTPIKSLLAVSAVAALALTGCGRSDSSTTATSGAAGAAAGAGTLIGVALPQKTSENWVLAEQLFKDGLTAAGYKGDVQFANGGVSEQQNQIQSMVTKGAKVIVVGAIDGSQLGTQLKAAKDGGATVIAYDRLIKNTAASTTTSPTTTSRSVCSRAQAPRGRLKAKKPNGPYNIELFAGSPDDANAQVFFDGAMERPQAEDRRRHPQGRLGPEGLHPGRHPGLEGRERAEAHGHPARRPYYSATDLDGVLSPNDTLARAILTSVKASGKPIPGRHRSGLRGRVGQVDHGRRAVLHDQQGHPQPRQGDHRDGHRDPEG